MTGSGNEAQARIIADQVAEAAIELYARRNPPAPPPPPAKPEIPPPLKWAAGIISGVMGAGVLAMSFWVVSTLSDLQQTVTRIDERQKLVAQNGDARFVEIDRRVSTLETYHRNGSEK